MRRVFLAAAIGAVGTLLLTAGYLTAQGEEPTVETRTFPFTFTTEGVATFTVPTVTVVSTETVTTASTSTGTTTEPPPPPPPPTEGTTLEFTDQQWRCSQSIASLATNGLPLRVTLNFTRQFPEPAGSGAAFLGNGCNGDGNPESVDLVLDIKGDGRTYGPGGDAIRLANAVPGPSDLVISGHADCGPRYGAAHQDGVQILGGTNIIFRDFSIGDYDGEVATCHTAGGAIFYSGGGSNIDVEGGKYIGCNHGLLAGWPTPGSDVRDASFRTAGRPICVQPETFAVSRPCDVREEWYDAGGTVSGLVCERWNGSAWITEPPQPRRD